MMLELRGWRVEDHVAEVIFFLFKIGESMLEPSVRLYIYQGVCLANYSTDDSCYNLSAYPDREAAVQRQAADYLIVYKFLINFPAIVLGFFCGAWSDTIGRKIPVLLTLVGSLLAVVLYIVSTMVGDGTTEFVPLVLVAAAIRGGFGKSAVLTMALYSYVCDGSSHEDRTKNIGRLLSMNYFGYFVGSLTAGGLLEVYGFDVIFGGVLVVDALCIVVAVVYMKGPDASASATDVDPFAGDLSVECGAKEIKLDRRHIASKMPFRVAHARDSVQVLTRPRQHRQRLHILLLFTTVFVQQTCKSGEVTATLLFAERAPLSWKKSMYGYLLATDYACLGVCMLVILPFLIRTFHFRDITMILIGVVFRVVRLSVLSCSSSTFAVYAAVVIGCPSSLVVSCTKALISKTVHDTERGKAFSLLSCAETVSALVGSVVFTGVYAATFEIYPGFVFALEAVFFVVLFLMLMALGHDMKVCAQYGMLQEVTGGGDVGAGGQILPAYGTTDADCKALSGTTSLGDGAAAPPTSSFNPFRLDAGAGGTGEMTSMSQMASWPQDGNATRLDDFQGPGDFRDARQKDE